MNSTDKFDGREPRPIENTRPVGGEVPRGEYEHGNLSRQPIKGDDRGGDLRQTRQTEGK